MADVFISYHVESALGIVEEIVEALEAREIETSSGRRPISCWYCKRDVPPGERWDSRLVNELRNCCAFVPILDNGAVKSPYVQAEVGYAFSRYSKSNGGEINIIPYKLEKCDLDTLALYLSRFQMIYAIPHTPKSMTELVNAVANALEVMEKTRREQEEEEKLSQILLKENQALKAENQKLRWKLSLEVQELRPMLPEKAAKNEQTPNDDLEILAGISEAGQKRRDNIHSSYDGARELAGQAESEEEPVHVMVSTVGTIIGRGHHSNVFKAELAGSMTPVALKVNYRNLLDEYPYVWEKVKALRSIENAHIQRFIDFVPDWEKNRSYMILEYVPGNTLQKLLYDRIQGGGAPFPQNQVLNWAFQILDTLEYLHTNGLLHGDINLSNIMLRPKKGNQEEEHDICLIDFNWAVPDLVGDEARPDIQSPDDPEEMFFRAGNAEAFRRGIRRDIYHVGAVMYQLLTGEVPDLHRRRAELIWEEATDVSEKRQNLQAHGVTDDVADVILKSISVDPANRYSSAERMRDALTKLPLTNSKAGRKSNHRKIAALSWLCAVLGALLILLGAYGLGADNGTKTEIASRDETNISHGWLLPSVHSGDRPGIDERFYTKRNGGSEYAFLADFCKRTEQRKETNIMPDRTLILTGAGAPEWCRALLETGKFIRLWRGQMTRQASGLYGASREAYPYGGVDWRNPPRGSRNERPAKSLRYDKTRSAKKDDKEEPDFGDLPQPSKAPEQDGVSMGYALRASGRSIVTLLHVLRDFPDIFRMDERSSTTVVDCASQAKARDTVLRRIYDTLSARESA